MFLSDGKLRNSIEGLQVTVDASILVGRSQDLIMQAPSHYHHRMALYYSPNDSSLKMDIEKLTREVNEE